MKERLKKFRERLVNKMRIYRFRLEDFVDNLFGRIMVRDAFYLLDELEECPPEDEHSPQLQLSYAIIYMTDKEFENYRTRLRRLKASIHERVSEEKFFERTHGAYHTDYHMAQRRERIRYDPF